MDGKNAAWVLVVICLLLAVSALAGKIDAKIAGGAFAAALAVLGVLSRGFTRRTGKPTHT